MDALKQRLNSDFVPEWAAVGMLTLLAGLWAFHIQLQLTHGQNILGPVALLFGTTLLLRAFSFRRGGLIVEYLALSCAVSTAVCALSYLSLASSQTLVDGQLMAMDRALGFDWLAGYNFVQSHPALSAVLGFAYDSLIYQGLYFGLLLGLMNDRLRLKQMFWLVLVSGSLACLGALLLPVLGPSKLFNIQTDSGFVPVMEHLLSGRDKSFSLSGMTGVISFPSFHTSMALAYIWAFRKTGVIGWAVTGLNLVMLCAVPWFGGHYLVDMIAGAVTMLVSLAAIKTAPLLWEKFLGALAAPKPAQASA